MTTQLSAYKSGLRKGDTKRKKRMMLLGGVLAVGALGTAAYFLLKPKGPTSNSTAGTFWSTLSASNQATYKTALYTWIANNPGSWPASVESPAQAGITSAASLNDPGNLSTATDGYQTANSIQPAAGQGTVDLATYVSVTGSNPQ